MCGCLDCQHLKLMTMMAILLQAPYFVITSVDSKCITEMKRERKKKEIFLGGCDLPIPVPGIIASEEPGLSAERETGGGRRGPFDVMWGPEAG
jgi:hypothetical protein